MKKLESLKSDKFKSQKLADLTQVFGGRGIEETSFRTQVANGTIDYMHGVNDTGVEMDSDSRISGQPSVPDGPIHN